MTTEWKDIRAYKEGHSVKLHRGGPDFFDYQVQQIDNAKSSIHYQVYVIESDHTGNMIFEALIRAAKRGVQVHLVVDSFGSDKIEKNDEQRLINSGIDFKKFEPYVSGGKFYVGRRMHHKVIVIDEKIGIVGGMNVADRYRGTATKLPWMDYAVSVTGPVVEELTKACVKILERTFLPSTPKWFKISSINTTLNPDKVWVRMRKNDWLRNKREITASYNKAVGLARDSITIVGGYFLPGRRFLRLLGSAAKNNVEVKIILTSFSDVQIVKRASEYLYNRLLKNKIRIYEAKESMVHGKVAVIDKTWATVGSYNQNHLSAYISVELNLDIVNSEFAENLHQHLEEVITNECFEITPEAYIQSSTIFMKANRWVSYQLVRLSLRLLFVLNRIFTIHD